MRRLDLSHGARRSQCEAGVAASSPGTALMDARLRYVPGPPLVVDVNLNIRSMGPISEIDMVSTQAFRGFHTGRLFDAGVTNFDVQASNFTWRTKETVQPFPDVASKF